MKNPEAVAQAPLTPSASRAHWLYLAVAVLALGLALIPLFRVRGYYIDVLWQFCFFAGLATAWIIVGGFGGMISLGHAAFTGLGAYTSTLLLLRMGVNPWVGLVIGALVAAAVAGILGYPCFRFGLRADFFALATLVFGIIVYELVNGLPTITGGPYGVVVPFAGNNPARFSFTSRSNYFYVAWVYWLLTVAVAYLVQHSRFGLRLMALREDEHAAARAGIDVGKVKLAALMISAALAGLAGTLYAQYYLFIEPTEIVGLGLSVEIVVIAIVGGISSFLGGTLGALILVPLTQLLNIYLAGAYAGSDLFIYGLILMIIIRRSPAGIVGLLRRRFPEV